MPATRFEPVAFYEGLVEHGLIIPVGVKGIFGRGPVFEDVLHRFDEQILHHRQPVIDAEMRGVRMIGRQPVGGVLGDPEHRPEGEADVVEGGQPGGRA